MNPIVFTSATPDSEVIALFKRSWERYGWSVSLLPGKRDGFSEMSAVGGGLYASPEVINYGFGAGDLYSPVFTVFDREKKAYMMLGTPGQYRDAGLKVAQWTDPKASISDVFSRIGNGFPHVQPDGAEYESPGWSTSKVVWFSPKSVAHTGLGSLPRVVRFVRPVK